MKHIVNVQQNDILFSNDVLYSASECESRLFNHFASPKGKDITPVQLLAACYSLGKHGFGQDLKIFYCIFLWLNAPDIGNSVIQWENISILGKAVLSIPGVPSNSVSPRFR
jgi:hypothetical protein